MARRGLIAVLCTGMLALLAIADASAAESAATIAAKATPAHTRRAGAVVVSGQLADTAAPAGGVLVELEARIGGAPLHAIAHVLTGPTGSFSFPALKLYVTTRLRVYVPSLLGVISGSLPVTVSQPGFPGSRQVLAAAHFLGQRAGQDAFAVIDSAGRLAGVNIHRRYHSASVVKSMLLVAYLRMLAQAGQPLQDGGRDLLYPMIHSSSNEAASAVLAIVGEDRLDGVARLAGMTDYVPGGATWGFTEISAADLARFFYRLDSLLPARFRGYARWLLSTIEPSESWGVPAVARPRYEVFFKGGWLPEVEGLVNQVARLEGHGRLISMAVLTRDDPSMEYGEQTIEGVTARLLAGPASNG